MRKNILILVFSVVLLSLLNTRTSFMSSNNTDSTNYINLPEFPISFNADISFIELATNFVNRFELDYSVNDISLNSRFVSLFTENSADDTEIIQEDKLIIEDNIEILQEGDHLVSHNTLDDSQAEENLLINETIYRIQIGAFINALSDEALFGVDNVISFLGEDGLIRYMVGSFTDYQDAFNYHVQMISRGFDDCYVIVDNNGDLSKYVTPHLVLEIDNKAKEINDVKEDNIDEEVITDNIEEEILKEEVEDVVEKIIKKRVREPVLQEVIKEDPLPSDKDIIKRHPNIKENAKALILEALEEGDIIIADVFDLLNEYAGENINKKKVKRFIKRRTRK